MATLVCQSCGANWSDEPRLNQDFFTTFLFATPMNPKGSYLTIPELINTGEMLIACPKDPIPRLDAAIQRKGQGPRSRARVTGRRDPTRQT